jgi:hypothetical protein
MEFETDFEPPALEENSRAEALSDADADLECSEFELALDEEGPLAEDRTRSRGVSRETARQGDRLYRRRPGLIQRLLGPFRGGKKRAQVPVLDREPYRQRVADLLQALRSRPTADAATRLGSLRSLFPKLEALFKDLAMAGDRHPSVKHLGEVLLRVQALLTEPRPAEATVQDLWLQMEAALQDWLASVPAAQPAPLPKEGFWK